MFMSWPIVTCCADVKVGTSQALVSIAYDRGDIAEVACYSVVNDVWFLLGFTFEGEVELFTDHLAEGVDEFIDKLALNELAVFLVLLPRAAYRFNGLSELLGDHFWYIVLEVQPLKLFRWIDEAGVFDSVGDYHLHASRTHLLSQRVSVP